MIIEKYINIYGIWKTFHSCNKCCKGGEEKDRSSDVGVLYKPGTVVLVDSLYAEKKNLFLYCLSYYYANINMVDIKFPHSSAKFLSHVQMYLSHILGSVFAFTHYKL